jgi:Na+/melibiose symporter-like transporter
MDQPPGLPETTSRRGLLLGLGLGLPVIGYGLGGAIVDATDTHPPELARWVIGAALVNDLIVVPGAAAAALVVRRFTPRRAWAPARAGLAATGILVLVGWPFVRGYGRDPTNPSLLPRNYGAGLAAAIGVVWLAVALWIAWCYVRARITRRSSDSRPPSTRSSHPGR